MDISGGEVDESEVACLVLCIVGSKSSGQPHNNMDLTPDQSARINSRARRPEI